MSRALEAMARLIETHTMTADKTAAVASAEAVAASAGQYRIISIENLDATESMRVSIGGTPTATQGERIKAGATKYFRTDKAINAIREGGSDLTYAVNVYIANND